eukprot:3070090-Prymnesium_polylepis.2
MAMRVVIKVARSIFHSRLGSFAELQPFRSLNMQGAQFACTESRPNRNMKTPAHQCTPLRPPEHMFWWT